MELSLADSIKEPSEGFVRQRRNLIVLSVLTIFIRYAERTLDNSVKLFGFAFKIGNPDVLDTFLVILLGYFAWRFHQFSCRHMGLFGSLNSISVLTLSKTNAYV
jgi:hypothetical protein